jgi:hypothetical protein
MEPRVLNRDQWAKEKHCAKDKSRICNDSCEWFNGERCIMWDIAEALGMIAGQMKQN